MIATGAVEALMGVAAAAAESYGSEEDGRRMVRCLEARMKGESGLRLEVRCWDSRY